MNGTNFRESGSFSFIPPFVDLAPQPPVRTFGDFRRRFAIPSPNNKRVVFKEHVLGEPSHFQWAAISEDSTALPIFCGQIVAEVQTLSEVEYLRRELEHMTTEKQKLQRALDKAKKLLKATQKMNKTMRTNSRCNAGGALV
uniref:Uncharacterized protein n=1 Tax=Globodera rostochiensis TaxID=31243 RepID=A0A914I441_GLORO